MRKEEIILSALTKDSEFTKKVIPFIQPEFFQSYSERVVYSLIQDFWARYSKLPTKDVLTIELEERKDIPENEYDDAKQTLKSAFSDTYEYEVQWLLDETERFCKDRAVYNAIMGAVKIINGDDKKRSEGEIPSMLQDALAISFDHNIGHDYFGDAEKRFEFYTRKENRIPCSIELMNKVTSGGIPRKTLNLFVAQPKGGKSLAMCSMAADYLKQGLNVLYITLELAEERVAERIDANLFNISIQDIKTLDHGVFIDRVSQIQSKTHGKLKIKEYPTKTASAANFKVLLDDLEGKEGFVPDVIFVDYLGITASSKYKQGNNVNSYTEQKSISEELRALAGERNAIMWTALQTNRSGFNVSDFDIENISDSSGPIMSCDFAVGLIRTPELDEMNQMIVKQLASRYGDPSYYKRFVVGVDRARMKIYNVDITAQDGLSKDVDNNQPKASADRYSKTKEKTVKSEDWEY